MYLVWDTVLQTEIVLKVVPCSAVNQRERLQREAQALAKLAHPGIVRCFDYTEFAGHAFLALEYVAGKRTLGTELRAYRHGEGCPNPRETAKLFADVANALEHAHQRQVVHRDIKPDNILLTKSGKPVLTDFGLAKLLAPESCPSPENDNKDLTGADVILGTPAYLSPEQAQGNSRNASHLSDVYSFGAVFYEMLTGKPPVKAQERMACCVEIANEDKSVPPPDSVPPWPEVPRDLKAILLKCLEKRPERRYQSAAAVEADVRRYLDCEPVDATPPSLGKSWCRLVASFRGDFANPVLLLPVILLAGFASLLFHYVRAGAPILQVQAEIARRTHTFSPPPLPGFDLSWWWVLPIVLAGYGCLAGAGLLTAWLVQPKSKPAAARAGVLVGLGHALLLSPLAIWLFGVYASFPRIKADLQLLGEAAGSTSPDEARTRLGAHPSLKGVPEQQRGAILSRQVAAASASYSLIGAIVGLLWAVMVGSVALALATVRGKELLDTGRSGAVILTHMESVWPLALLLARLGDTFLTAPFFCGWFTFEHRLYAALSVAACAVLGLMSWSAWAEKGIGRSWQWRSTRLAFWLTAYVLIFVYARTQVYQPNFRVLE